MGQVRLARARASDLACASSADQAPISTSRKPDAWRKLVEFLSASPLRRMNSTSRWSNPSRPMGWCSRARGTASAARNPSENPRTVRMRKGGLAVRLSVAETTLRRCLRFQRVRVRRESRSHAAARRGCSRRRGAGCGGISRGRDRRSGRGGGRGRRRFRRCDHRRG